MKFIDFPDISFPIQGIEEVQVPKMVRIRQNFDKDEIADPSNYLLRLPIPKMGSVP